MKTLDALFRLEKKVAIVTGDSFGIGRAKAWVLGKQGVRVVLIARSQAALQSTADEFAADGITACSVSADLGDSAQRLDAIDRAIAPFGAPDILVNSAGNNIRRALPYLIDDDIRATLALNLEAPLALIRAFAPAMQAKGWGRIINIAAQQSFRAFNNSGVYGPSKAALVPLTRSSAEHYSRYGVACNKLATACRLIFMAQQLFWPPMRARS